MSLLSSVDMKANFCSDASLRFWAVGSALKPAWKGPVSGGNSDNLLCSTEALDSRHQAIILPPGTLLRRPLLSVSCMAAWQAPAVSKERSA